MLIWIKKITRGLTMKYFRLKTVPYTEIQYSVEWQVDILILNVNVLKKNFWYIDQVELTYLTVNKVMMWKTK